MSANGFNEAIGLKQISDDGRAVEIVAGPAHLTEIAKRLDLEGLDSLSANLHVTRDGPAESTKTGVFVSGEFRASGTQTCVVSLRPVPFEIAAPIDGMALPADSAEFEREELTLEDDEVELLGEIEDGRFDLAEIVVQQLALELDPFPRADDAEPHWQGDDSSEAEAQAESPFAALAKLKETLK